MRVYIDAGAYEGDTLDCAKLFNFNADYKIAFEPNPKYFPMLAQMGIDELDNVGVWVSDEIKEFAVDNTETPMGSTLMPGKKNSWAKFPKLEVHCIDFAQYLKDLYERLDVTELLVKLDIEGAEFPVLEQLIETGADKLITKLYVEMHPNKVVEYTTTYSDELLERLSCEVVKWH